MWKLKISKHYFTLFVGLIMFVILQAKATELGNNMEIKLLPQDGEPLVVGHVDFTSADKAFLFKVRIDDSKFADYFLNMRPFKCLQGPKYMICHLAYPYKKGQSINADNLIDLEYDLLFIHRKATDYGIDPWNGLYYKLTMSKDGIKGELKVVDLDILAAPPEGNDIHPIKDYDLHDADPDAHSYPLLSIQ